MKASIPVMTTFFLQPVVCVDQRFDTLGPLGTTLDAAQVPRFHDAMPEARHSEEQRPRESSQPRVHAFDEDAAGARRSLGAGALEPIRGHAATQDEPRSVAIKALEEVLPGDRLAAAAV